MILPPELDYAFYRSRHLDLATHSDESLEQHYRAHGIREGRQGSPAAVRADFISAISEVRPAIEIGPFYQPVLSGDGVQYFDVLDQAGLRARAKAIGGIPEQVPVIDYVSPTGDLSIVDRRFELAVSSHSIEHQPDLVRHLQRVEGILTAGGLYALLIPDHRYCFDHFIPASTIAEVLQAYIEERKVHTLKSIVEHRYLTTHNSPHRHWNGDHGESAPPERLARLKETVSTYKTWKDTYVDVHAWQFTPDSFRTLISTLRALGMIRLEPVRVYNTPRWRGEFTALLRAA